MIITKVGFRAIKWGVKKLWKGLKALVFKAVSFFKSLFKLGGKFVNKVSHWMLRLGKGVVDKTYRFLVKPIANMMFSVFGFFTGLLMSPIKFMQWLIPSVFEKIRNTLHSIKQGVKGLLKSTWNILQKILFNPLTIALLIGGLFLLLCPGVLGMLSGGLQGIKEGLFPVLQSIGEKIWSFLKGAWDIITAVGGFLFTWIDKITSPDGWIVSTVASGIGMIMSIKKWIKKMMKAAGKDSIDIFCMFLAGDLIGIVINMIAGLCVKMWKWLKHKNIFRLALGLVKLILSMHAMILGLGVAFICAILNAGLKLAKWIISKVTGGFFGGGATLGDVVDAFVYPFKVWWDCVKGLFEFGKEDIAQADMKKTYVEENPSEIAAEQKKDTHIAINSLKNHGKGKG